MRIGKWAYVVLAATTALFTGCSGFWDAVPSSGDNGGGSGSTTGVFYLLSGQNNNIVAYSVSSSTAAPAELSGAIYDLGAAPLAVAVSPNGSFLYASTAAGIYMYSIASSGTLALGNGNQVISSDLPTTMVVDPTGQWLIETTSGTGVISAIPLVSTTGLYNSSLQVQTTTLNNVTTVNQMAIAPSGSMLFLALGTAGTAAIPFTASSTGNPFGSGTTVATANPTRSSLASALSVAVDPSSRLVYIGETLAVSGTQTGGLRAFPITTTGLGSEASGSPYATAGTGPAAILPMANYVYVANKAVSGATTGNITGFPINVSGATYSLGTSVGSVTAGSNTLGLVAVASSTYVVAMNAGGSPDASVYTVNATTGALTAATPLSSSTSPVAIAVP